MTTRKSLIKEKYIDLYKYISSQIDGTLLPNIETLDVSDLVFFITFFFVGIHELKDFDTKIEEMMISNQIIISSDSRHIISQKIMEFVVWMRAL